MQKIMQKGGMNNVGEDNFNTKAYLLGLYNPKTPPTKGSPLKDSKGQPRQAKFEDGILYGDYRLPTEAEWEYASYGYMMENPQRRRTRKIKRRRSDSKQASICLDKLWLR
jgi:sulfatase modifying factor 1